MELQKHIKALQKPWQEIIQKYIILAKELDGILLQLTRTYCAHCPRNAEYGCCDFAEEATRGLPEEIVHLQRIECIDNGGTLTSRNGICPYHTPKGCSLVLLKSPSCFGQICQDLRDDLCQRFGNQAQPFIDSMRIFGHSSMKNNPNEMINNLNKAVEEGKNLIRM